MSDYNKKTFTKKCILSCLFVISLLMTCFTVKVYAKENVKLNHKKLTMQDGKTKTLKLSGTSKKVTWTSSNKAVVKVVSTGSNKATLTAKEAGTATVTAKVDKKKYKCKVTVKYKKYKDVYVTIGKKQYTLTLYDNASAKQLYQQLPMTITMDEMNGNEKYYYMNTKFKTKAKTPYKIQTGDLMLYGNDCLVFFYKNFKTEYSYTPLGRLKNTSEFAKAVGKDSVEITISGK